MRATNTTDPLFKAAAIINDRVRATALYQDVFVLAVEYAVTATLACSTLAELRAAGGRSEITRRALERALAETPGLDDPAGSSLCPQTARTLLKADFALVKQAAYEQEMRVRTRGAA